MSNPRQPRNNPSLKSTVNTGLKAQSNVHDQMWYAVNFNAYNVLLTDVDLSVNSKPSLDREYDDPSEERAAIEAYKKAHPVTYYTPEEIQSLNVPTSHRYRLETDNVERLLENNLARDENKITTLQEENNRFLDMGIVGAKVCHELGKSYHYWLDKLPQNEPDREEKAAFLVFYDSSSKSALLARGYKNFQQRLAMSREDSDIALKRQDTFLKDADALKNMTMGEYCNKAMMSRKQEKAFYRDHQFEGLEVSEKTTAYDFFRNMYLEKKRKTKRKDPGKTPVKIDAPVIKEPEPESSEPEEPVTSELKEGPELEEAIANEAFKQYRKCMRGYQTTMGRDLAVSNMSPEDRKLAEEGSKFFEKLNYEIPKSIRNWEEQGRKMLRDNRIQQLNDSYRDLNQVVRGAKPVELQKDPVLAPSFRKGPYTDRYDKYLRTHTGQEVLHLSSEQKRTALANAMAAASMKGNGKSYSVDTIHAWGKLIMKKEAFQNLTEEEVSRFLFNKDSVNDARYRLTKDLYSVPKENQRDYLLNMKNLANDMHTTKGDSQEYKNLVKYVKAIGAMNINDPQLDDKLVIANEQLRHSIMVYAKGKKSIRTFNDGREKFSNCLDALAEMEEHVPGMKHDAREMVERTNKVRKVESGPDFVDLKDYGSGRASLAKAERELAKGKEDIPNSSLVSSRETNVSL